MLGLSVKIIYIIAFVAIGAWRDSLFANCEYGPVGTNQLNDWLVSDSAACAVPSSVSFDVQSSTLILSNGLITRKLLTSPALCTIEYQRLMPGANFTYLRALAPEGNVTLNSTVFDIGGCAGVPDGHAEFWDPDTYLHSLYASPNSFTFHSFTTKAPTAFFPWTPGVRGSPSNIPWPPKGVHVTIQLTPPTNASYIPFSGVSIQLHYEIYDCIPAIRKWITIENSNSAITPVVVTTLNSELLRAPNGAPERISILSDEADNPLPWDDQIVPTKDQDFPSREKRLWFKDPDYDACCDRELHAPYTYYTYLVAGYAPSVVFGGSTGPGALILPGEKFTGLSFRFILHDTDANERKGLSLRRVQCRLAPHLLENPLHMMITDISSSEAMRTAVDQASKVGLELVIIGFGANGYCGLCDAQMLDPKWRSWFANEIKYARSMNIDVSAYTLMQHNGWGEDVPVSEQALDPRTGQRQGVACFATDWHERYRQNVLDFIKNVSLSGLETDGQYESYPCADDTGDHRHDGLAGAWDAQTKITMEFNSALKKLGIYQTGADSYIFSGVNRWNEADTDAGYGLSSFWERLTIGRLYSYDSTSTRLPSSGMYGVNEMVSDATSVCGESGRLQCIDFVLGTFISTAAYPYLRAPYIYDPSDKDGNLIAQVFINWMQFYKAYRNIIIGDYVHLSRPTSRTVEIALLSDRFAENVFGIVSMINPTNHTLTANAAIPLYYSNVPTGSHVMSQQVSTISEDGLKVYDGLVYSSPVTHKVGAEGYGLYDIAITGSIAPRSYAVFMLSRA